MKASSGLLREARDEERDRLRHVRGLESHVELDGLKARELGLRRGVLCLRGVELPLGGVGVMLPGLLKF